MSKNLPVKNIATLESVLEEQEDKLSALLPADMDISFFKANVIAACSANPKLIQECTRSSLIKAVYEASELGLMVHSSLGESWIIQYGNNAVFIPGYRGLVKLAFQSGFVKMVEARARYSHDIWECEYGLNPKLRLVESRPNRGALLGVYCKVDLMTGGFKFEYLDIEEIENEIHSKSAAYKYFKKTGRGKEIWGDPHNKLEMDKKAVWRGVAKWIPLSGRRMDLALEIDNRQYTDYYEVDHDAEERLYRSVGVLPAKKDSSAKKEDAAIADMVQELSFVFGSDAYLDDSEEMYDLAELILASPNAFNGELEKNRPDDLSEISAGDCKTITKIIRRARKFLIGSTLTPEEGQARVLAFFRFCMLNQYLINTTRNLDAARSAFVDFEKSDG